MYDINTSRRVLPARIYYSSRPEKKVEKLKNCPKGAPASPKGAPASPKGAPASPKGAPASVGLRKQLS